jgi:hypothetical protein
VVALRTTSDTRRAASSFALGLAVAVSPTGSESHARPLGWQRVRRALFVLKSSEIAERGEYLLDVVIE